MSKAVMMDQRASGEVDRLRGTSAMTLETRVAQGSVNLVGRRITIVAPLQARRGARGAQVDYGYTVELEITVTGHPF